jgi:hypothetical protein
MSYKTPAYSTLTGLKGIDKRIETIAGHMTDLTWLSYSFGLAERDVNIKDGKENIIPTIYQNLNSKDPLSLMPSDLYDAFSFWVKEPEGIFREEATRLRYKVSCIFFCDLKQIAPDDNYKVTKTRICQDILKFFRIHENAGFGQLNILSIIDDDITQVYKGFTISQIDNKYRMLPKYAIRVNFDYSFLNECDVYNKYLNYSDLYLPSWEELDYILQRIKLYGLGNFSNISYWTSTEDSATKAHSISFATSLDASSLKTATFGVRACRNFEDIAGKYSLRDVGPAGGYIFYINGAGTRYWEVAPSDLSSSCAWSNIINAFIGDTSPDINEGQQNTVKIINQVGHLTSAAKLCDDLIIYHPF